MATAAPTPENLEAAARHFIHLAGTALSSGTARHLVEAHGATERPASSLEAVRLHAAAHDVPNVPTPDLYRYLHPHPARLMPDKRINITWGATCPSCGTYTDVTGYDVPDTPETRVQLGTLSDVAMTCMVCGQARLPITCLAVAFVPYVGVRQDPDDDEPDEREPAPTGLDF